MAQDVNIGIDAQTLQIRAICVTSNNVSDAAVIPDLLQQLPQDEALESLTGNGAYDTQPVYEAVIKRGAIPIIAPRKNARIRKGLGEVSGTTGLGITGVAWWKPR